MNAPERVLARVRRWSLLDRPAQCGQLCADLTQAHWWWSASRLQIDAAAIEAYEAMTDVGGWGNAPWRNLWRDFTAAAARVGLSHVRPYDLRHARGALLYAAGQDLAAVSRLLLHASLSTTRRYAAAAADVDAKVVAKVAAILRGDSAQHSK